MKIRSIEERMRRIEASGREVLARDEKIQAKLNEVRVWSSRRRRL